MPVALHSSGKALNFAQRMGSGGGDISLRMRERAGRAAEPPPAPPAAARSSASAGPCELSHSTSLAWDDGFIGGTSHKKVSFG